MSAARTVTATFTAAATDQTLTVNKAGTGTGTRDVEPGRDQLRQRLHDAERQLPERHQCDAHGAAAGGIDVRGLERRLHRHRRLHRDDDAGAHGDGDLQHDRHRGRRSP